MTDAIDEASWSMTDEEYAIWSMTDEEYAIWRESVLNSLSRLETLE